MPLGLLVIVSVFWILKGEWTEAKGEKFDLTGSVILGFTIAAIVYGLTILPAMLGIWTLLIGVSGILIFIWLEGRVASPVLNLDLFRRNTVFGFSNLAALINYSATFAVTFLLSLYLQYTKGLSAQNAGLILASMPAVQAILSPAAGSLSDRIEPRVLASIGMGLSTVGLGLLVFLNQNTTVGFILVSLIVLGVGFAFFSSPNENAIMSSVDKRSYGVAAAVLATVRQIGMTLSMGIAMLIFTLYIGRVEITIENYPSFLMSVQMAFIVFASLCFSGIFASLARGKLRQ